MNPVKKLLWTLAPTSTRRAVRSFVHKRLHSALQPRILRFTQDGKRVFLSSTAQIDLNRVTFGDNLWIWHGSTVNSEAEVEFGEFCYLAERVEIVTHTAHLQVWLYGRKFSELAGAEKVGRISGPVKIGAFTFIGPNSVIMPRTTIGRGSMVNAFSYVQGDFPPFSIIGGNPAKVLGDSRTLIRYYLKRHPELREHYEDWALEDG